MQKSVVITGMGCVVPKCLDVDTMWKKIISSQSLIGLLKNLELTECEVKIGGEIDSEQLEVLKKEIEKWSQTKTATTNKSTLYGLYASGKALQDAGLLNTEYLKETAISYGIGQSNSDSWLFCNQISEMLHSEDILDESSLEDKLKINEVIDTIFSDNYCGITPAKSLSSVFGVNGPVYNYSSACASGTIALGEAYQKIKNGEISVALSGASDSMVDAEGIVLFSKLQALSTNNHDPSGASRPFDLNRNGFVLSEGAAALVLEERGHAEKRGAKIYGEIVGYGCKSDRYHVTSPDPSGKSAKETILEALEDAGVAAEDIDYINAHGTATLYNDTMESEAIKAVFGGRKQLPACSSSKSIHGHLISAAGALEAIICLCAINDNLFPPSINISQLDPRCDVNIIKNAPVSGSITYAISNSFGFGGQNAVIVLKKNEKEMSCGNPKK